MRKKPNRDFIGLWFPFTLFYPYPPIYKILISYRLGRYNIGEIGELERSRIFLKYYRGYTMERNQQNTRIYKIEDIFKYFSVDSIERNL